MPAACPLPTLRGAHRNTARGDPLPVFLPARAAFSQLPFSHRTQSHPFSRTDASRQTRRPRHTDRQTLPSVPAAMHFPDLTPAYPRTYMVRPALRRSSGHAPAVSGYLPPAGIPSLRHGVPAPRSRASHMPSHRIPAIFPAEDNFWNTRRASG